MALPALIPAAAAVAAAAIKVAPEFRTGLNGAERTQLALEALKTTADVAGILAPVVQTYLREAASVERARIESQVSVRRVGAAEHNMSMLMALHGGALDRMQSDEHALAVLQSASAASAGFFAHLVDS